jgi:type II secretory pathway component PulL
MQPTPLFLPTAHLAIHTVTLPPTPAHRLQAALAGVLEEQLLDDPADVHMALAPNAPAMMSQSQPFEVMVCNKAWLQARVDAHRLQGLNAARIVPGDAALEAAGWNLAQFEFRPKAAWLGRCQSAWQAVWRGAAWRWARRGALVLVVVQLMGVNVWAWRERSDLADKRAAIDRVLTQTFPQTTTVVDAPVQMERAVAALRSGSGILSDKDFERLLASKAQSQSAGKAIVKIDFVNGALTTEVAP